jgi:hypothetical protein
MKKYLFGLFALVLAIGFSAFTAPAKNSGEDTFYWYSVENGLVVELIDQEEITKEDAKDATGCFDVEEQPVCAAAYESNTVAPETPVEITEPERLILRNL